MDQTASLIREEQVGDVKSLTFFLYCLAKFRYTSGDKEFLDRAAKVLLSEELTIYSASRNLWNLEVLGFNPESDDLRNDLLTHLTQTILKHQTSLNEFDVADTVKALTGLDFLDFNCLEVCLKWTLSHASEMKATSLAVILEALVSAEVINQTLFVKISEEIERRIGEGQEIGTDTCVKFLSAYCQAEKFEF